jgi:hypothetical protein
MNRQTGFLASDHDEWIFATYSDKDEPEQVWEDLDAVMEELQLGGWEVVQGLAPIRFDIEKLQQYKGLGYRLGRRIQ